MLRKFFDNFEECLLGVLMPVMCLVVFSNTVGRYSGWYSLPWAEEAGRYMMIWMVFVGLAAAAKRNAHFSVQLIFLITPKRLHRYFNLFIMIVVVAFCLFVGFLGSKFVLNLYRMVQASPSLALPMWTVYMALPLGLLLMALRTLQYYARNFKTAWDIADAATKELKDSLGEDGGSKKRS